jgi:hypothetical protein
VVNVDGEGLNVKWGDVEVDIKIEPLEGHREPSVEVGVKLNVWIELASINVSIGEIDSTKAPVPGALDVPFEAGFPVSDEGGPGEGIIVLVVFFVGPDEDVIEGKKFNGFCAVSLDEGVHNT